LLIRFTYVPLKENNISFADRAYPYTAIFYTIYNLKPCESRRSKNT